MTLSLFPRHVAIIMDGNGRWAKKRHMPRLAGHKAGVDVVRKIVKSCVEKKIEVLSLFAFGMENWQRPLEEVNYLMILLITALKNEIKKLHQQNVQLRIIGDRQRFSTDMRKYINKVETLTANNTGLKLVVAVSYSGRWDLCEAMRHIAVDIEEGKISSRDITPLLIQNKLTLADLPEPDLLIRTSGEQRISNFMLWQFAYTELYFSEVFWPDFNETEFDRALAFFAHRERRFGVTGEQLRDQQHA